MSWIRQRQRTRDSFLLLMVGCRVIDNTTELGYLYGHLIQRLQLIIECTDDELIHTEEFLFIQVVVLPLTNTHWYLVDKNLNEAAIFVICSRNELWMNTMRSEIA